MTLIEDGFLDEPSPAAKPRRGCLALLVLGVLAVLEGWVG
jgi:hypothetical protein